MKNKYIYIIIAIIVLVIIFIFLYKKKNNNQPSINMPAPVPKENFTLGGFSFNPFQAAQIKTQTAKPTGQCGCVNADGQSQFALSYQDMMEQMQGA